MFLLGSKDTYDQRIAVIGTIIFHLILLVIILFSCLQYPPEDKPIPHLKESEILLEGEYVIRGDVPEPNKVSNKVSAPKQPKQEVASASEELMSSSQESPMKVVEPEVSEEELARQEEEKRQAEVAERIRKQVKFGNKGTGDGDGNSGTPDGNSTVGATSGAPGYSLKGRTAERWGTPRSNKSGAVVVRVSVDRDGKVISAKTIRGEGAAYADLSIRRRCEAASMESKFSVDREATAIQTGTITWRFK